MEDLPIGIRIKDFREREGLGKKAFAKKHNLDIDNFYKWEKGTNPSNPEDYKKLESILNGEVLNEDRLSETALRLLKMLEKEQDNVKREQDNVKKAHNIIRMLAKKEPGSTAIPKNVSTLSKLKPIKTEK